MAEKSGVNFTKQSADRITDTVHRVEADPFVGSQHRRSHRNAPVEEGKVIAFWGRIVLEGPTSLDVDKTDHTYWVRELEVDTALSGLADLDYKDDGLWIVAHNLAEFCLPTVIVSSDHSIVADVLDEDAAAVLEVYDPAVKPVDVPIYKLGDDTFIYVFNFLRPPIVKTFNYRTSKITDNVSKCPDTATSFWETGFQYVFDRTTEDPPVA